VLEKIGDGLVFSVYKSRDKVLNRLVALKVLSKDLASDSDCVEAVLTGYRGVAQLSHPNIARVLDVDCAESECFVACEFARGMNVKERVRKAGPIAAPNALDIIIPVLAALEYAHANRIVHGDIASQDIVVSPDGEVKLTDLGIWPAVSGCQSVSDRYAMRSVHYQAPEIAEGAAPQPASDIYSIGVVLYEMLTGQLPFGGATAIAVALKKVKELPTPPRSINTAIPKSLSDIVMRAMEAAPQNRYQSISAMLADIKAVKEALRTGHPVLVGQARAVAGVGKEQMQSEMPDQSMKTRFIWLVVVFAVVVLVSLGLTMFIAGGRAEVRIPPLLGKTWEEAQFIAQENNIKLIDDGRAYSEIYAAGQICSVTPQAGAMVPRDNPEVKVKISTGPSTVEMPDLTGIPEAQANETAVHAGFTIGEVKQEYSDKAPVNTVISQDPPAGVRRAPGVAIDLVISNGPKPEGENEPTTTPSSQSHRFKVNVEVSPNLDGDQEVQIIVMDDRGETTAYQETRQPGDRFTEVVTAYGDRPTIKIYVGGELVKEYTVSESGSTY
jgi:serine/threonine-protein kinase